MGDDFPRIFLIVIITILLTTIAVEYHNNKKNHYAVSELLNETEPAEDYKNYKTFV